MALREKTKDFLHDKKREFTNKRGRMGRSRFFANLCIICVFILVYVLALSAVMEGLARAGVPRAVYNNIYYIGTGILFLLAAFGTRPLRLKRLRDMGLPVRADLPFMLLLILNGLGPIFLFLNMPYLRNLEVITMPGNLRDLLGVFWLIWLLVLVIGPSKRRENLFACAAKSDQLK